MIDPDTVAVTNLQRQCLYTEEDATKKRLKVVAAKQHLSAINHQLQIEIYPEMLDFDHLLKLDFDLALDCLDNFTARLLLNQAALAKPFDYIFASCASTFGSIMPISARQYPCLGCVFPNLEQLAQIDCELLGVNTALIPLVSSIQISLALRYLVNKDSIDFENLITVDNWQLELHKFKIAKNITCKFCNSHTASAWIPFKKRQLSTLCGSKIYSGYLEENTTANLTTWLLQEQITVKKFRFFVSFVWQGHSISLFNNGKVLLYGLENLTKATEFFNKFNQQLEKIKLEAD